MFCIRGLLALSILPVALAQEQEPNNELAGTFGHTFISDQSVLNSGLANSRLGHGDGYTFEVDYARILRTSEWADIAVEVPAIFCPDEDLVYSANQVPEGYSSFFITPAARLRFVPDVAFSPWFSLGGGLGHFSSGSDLIFYGGNTAQRGVTTGVLQIGAGLDVRIPHVARRFKIRAEVRDDWSGMPLINVDVGKTQQHNYYVAGGLAYRF
jgi:hypothetical protein